MAAIEQTTRSSHPPARGPPTRSTRTSRSRSTYAGVNIFRGSFADFSATLAGGEEPTLEGSARSRAST